MTTSLRVVLVLLGLSLLALVLTGLPIYARLSYLWALLLVLSWVWSKLSLRGVTVERQARSRRAHVGQIFEERFRVENKGHLPRLWLHVRDGSDLPGSRGSRVLTLVGAGERRSYRVRTRLVQRGTFSLGPTEIVSGDLFGLFPVSQTVPSEGSLLVYPMMVNIRSFPGPPGLLPGGEALRLRTHQVTPNASGVREYVPGDPLSRIHWLSTARRNELIVKEFELDPMAEIWIYLDAETSVQAEQPYSPPSEAVEATWSPWKEIELPPSTEEYGVSIAASLARHFIRRDRAVGLAFCQDASRGVPDVMPPDRGGRQLGKILEALAPVQARGGLPISALATAHAQHVPRGSTLIIITPSAESKVALMADLLAQRGLRPVLVLLDAASFGGLGGTKDLADAVAAMGVPVRVVRRGDDLVSALSFGKEAGAPRPAFTSTQAAGRMMRT
ncbi:MAG: DUF58 domain-containing protein [Anaerolineae bacterium]